MSLPSRALFDRFCQINIGGRLFSGPPFSIEFDQTLKTGVLTATKARLYNPSIDTIKAAEPSGTGKVKTFTEVSINAGYVNDSGTAVLGQINDFKVLKRSSDVILEMTISDITQKWANSQVSKTWRKTTASTILSDIIAEAGIVTEISLGEDKTYRTFAARSLKGAIKKITADTESTFYFKNGILKIEPLSATKDREVLFISPTSGLLDKIEKTKDGFKFKTLFFYKLQMGDVIKIEDKNTPATTVKLFRGKKKFSTFKKSECVFEAKAI